MQGCSTFCCEPNFNLTMFSLAFKPRQSCESEKRKKVGQLTKKDSTLIRSWVDWLKKSESY